MAQEDFFQFFLSELYISVRIWYNTPSRKKGKKKKEAIVMSKQSKGKCLTKSNLSVMDKFTTFMKKELSPSLLRIESIMGACVSVIIFILFLLPLKSSLVYNVSATQDNVFTSGNIEVTVQKDIQLTQGELRPVSDFVTVRDTKNNTVLTCGKDYEISGELGKDTAGVQTWQGYVHRLNQVYTYDSDGQLRDTDGVLDKIPITITYTVNPKPVIPKTKLTLENVKVDYTATETNVKVNEVYVNGEKLKLYTDYRVDYIKTKRTGHHSYGTIRIAALDKDGEGRYEGEIDYPFQYVVKGISGKVTISKFLKKYCDTGIWQNEKTGKIRIGKTDTYCDFPTAYGTPKDGLNRMYLPFIEQARLKTKYTAKVADQRYMNCMLDDFAKLSVKEKQSKVCSFLYTDVVKVGNVTGRPVKVYVQAPRLVKNGAEPRPFNLNVGWKGKNHPHPLVVGQRIATEMLTWCGKSDGVNGSFFQAEQFEVRYTVKGKKGWKKISKTAIVWSETDSVAWMEAKGVSYKKAGKIQARLRRTVNGKRYYSKWVKVK